jgi:inner membrane protein
MMWHTHAAMGACATWLLLPLASSDDSATIAVLMALGVIGAMVPDLDAVESKIKHIRLFGIKPLVPVASAINRDFGHRGCLHSARGWALWTGLILPSVIFLGWSGMAALSLGYASHLISDSATKSGIMLCYPQRPRFYLLPKRWRVTTGSPVEEVIFVLAAMFTLALLLNQMSL